MASQPEYINILSKSAANGAPVVDTKNAPAGKPPHSYINVPLQDIAELHRAPEDGKTINGHLTNGSGNSTPSLTASTPVTTPSDTDGGFNRHSSLDSPRYSTVSPHRSATTSPISDAKMRLLLPGQAEGCCKNCDELSQLLAMWEIGVSGLTRNYSRILAHLIKIRTASMALEFRLKHPTSSPPQPRTNTAIPQSLVAPPSRGPKNRQSMFVNHTGSSAVAGDHDIAVNMYPERRATAETPGMELRNAALPASVYAADMNDLNSHLEEAIDLCQQLAAACFKTNHLSEMSRRNQFSGSGDQDSLSARKHSTGGSPSANVFKPSLHSIAEIRLTGSRKKKKGHRTLERTPSAPNLELSGEVSSGSHSGSDMENSFVKVSEADVPELVTKSKATKPSANDATKPDGLTKREGVASTKTAPSQDVSETPQGDSSLSSGIGLSVSDQDSGTYRPTDYRGQSMLSSISTYSDSDVKCVMSKIASLEEERYKLMETISALQEDNSVVRQSLQEMLGDLENKDLQLMLAMQDLTIATGEIQMAAEMRKKLNALSQERDFLLDKLSDLEDESAAVKVSLIQLLQEKSATNKTLALENFRLAERVRQSSRKPSKSSVGEGAGDNISVRSGYSATADDTTMQEAYIGAAMGENFVHKQGFLVKQGGKVKSWKKRLFVLNTEGLSYYRTDQPIQTVPIDKIDKVVICHKQCIQKHLFEVHTLGAQGQQGRTFFLSAPSADEMQSWVGMLETLKHNNRSTTLHREAAQQRESALLQDKAPGSGASSDSHPGRESASPAVEGRLSEEDEADEHVNLHQPVIPAPAVEGATGTKQQGIQKGVSLQLDDDDTAYLNNFATGSVPSYLAKGIAGGEGTPPLDLLSSLDLHKM